MTSCQGPRDSPRCCDGRGLWDASCSFNDFAPRHRSAREIQLPFFNWMRTLTPATPLQNMCVWLCECVIMRTDIETWFGHCEAWRRHLSACIVWSLMHVLQWICTVCTQLVVHECVVGRRSNWWITSLGLCTLHSSPSICSFSSGLENCSTSCQHIAISIMRFSASQTSHWWNSINSL